MKEKRNFIKKIPRDKRLCFGLAICLVILAGTVVYQAFAATGDEPSLYFVTYSNQQSKNKKASQLLEVKTEGFAKNAYLEYQYTNDGLYQTSDSNWFFKPVNYKSKLYIYPNPKTYEHYAYYGGSSRVLDYNESLTTNDRFLAVGMGEEPFGSIDASVKDINPASATYGKTAENSTGLNRSNQAQDMGQGMGAMFVGEEMEIRQLMATAGVTIGKEAIGTSSLWGFSILQSFDGANYRKGQVFPFISSTPNDGHFFKPTASGMISTRLTNDRSHLWFEDRFYLSSNQLCQTFRAVTSTFDFYVFEKKPTVKAVATSITVDNTMKGVTYSIGTDSQTAQSDDETLTFGKDEKLLRGKEYQLMLSKAVNGKTARAFIPVTTPGDSNIYFDYNGVQPTSAIGGSGKVEFGKDLSEFVPTALGYDFLSWNSAPDGTGTNYTQSGVTESQVTVYAQWDQREYNTKIRVWEEKVPLSNAKVELYQYGKKCYELTEDGATGVYKESGVPYAAYEEEDGAYDIYVDGVDSGVNFKMTGEEANGSNLEGQVHCYTAAVALEQNGQVWADQNVRIEKAGAAYTLAYDGGTKDYHGRFTYGEEKPKDGPYYIYVNEKMVKGENGTVTFYITDDLAKNKVSVSYYDMEVTLTKDGQPWGDAQVSLYRDGRLEYTLSYDGVAGTYQYDSILDVGSVYKLYVKGSNSKEDVGVELSDTNRNATVDYYTVSFQDDLKTYSKQIWKSGDRAKKPNTPVREGMTFRQWNADQDGTGVAYFTSGQTTTEPITSTLSIYATWEQPRLVIGNYVRVNESGVQDGKGLYYRMPNLSITGFPNEVGKTPIRVIKVETVNEKTKVKVKNQGAYQVTGEGTDKVTINLPAGASAAEAEQFIRTNILIQPDGDSTEHRCTVKAFGTTS